MPVLGYDVDRSGPSPKLVINAAEAKQVRQIFSSYIELQSLLPVAQRLQELGWPNKVWRTRNGRTRGGRTFDKCSVHSLLTNPLYIGKIKHKENVYEGEHDAIVDQETFNAVAKMLASHNRGKAQRLVNKHAALLKGLLVCPHCGYKMVHVPTKKGAKVYRYYSCQTAVKRGRDACPMGSVSAPMIEDAVVNELRWVVSDDGLRETVFMQTKTLLDNEQTELETQLAQFKMQVSRDTEEVRRIEDHEVFENLNEIRLADLKTRVSKSEADIARTLDKLKRIDDKRLTRLDIDIAMSEFDQVWASLTAKERTQLVELLVAKTTYDPEEGSLEVTYHPTAITALAAECEVTR